MSFGIMQINASFWIIQYSNQILTLFDHQEDHSKSWRIFYSILILIIFICWFSIDITSTFPTIFALPHAQHSFSFANIEIFRYITRLKAFFSLSPLSGLRFHTDSHKKEAETVLKEEKRSENAEIYIIFKITSTYKYFRRNNQLKLVF